MLLSDVIAIIPLLAFQIRSAFSDAEKLLHWIIEYISRVSCLSRACLLTVNFLKHIAVLGEGGQVLCIWHFRGKSGSHFFWKENQVADWLARWATKSVILGSGPTPSPLTTETATRRSVLGDTGKLIAHCNANSANQNWILGRQGCLLPFWILMSYMTNMLKKIKIVLK